MERLTEKIGDTYIAKTQRLSNGKIVGDRMCLDKLGKLEDAEEQGLFLKLPCNIGDEVYVIAECGNISPQLDGTLYGPNGGPGTATGYYCPYEDDCPHIHYSDDCDKCKEKSAIFKDYVKSIHIDDIDVCVWTENCNVLSRIGEYVFLAKEEAEQALARMEKENG